MAETVNSGFEKEEVISSRELHLVRLEKVSGGTCNAYTARIFGKKVFVKEIKPEYAGHSRMLAAFRKEAEIGFRLDHPNLPKYIYAEGVLPSDRYIVQEFIDGLTLPDFIEHNPAYFQNRQNVERFLREFADVVDYLHRNQIVHLDLKPENILISRVGTSLKLTDLGCCASDFYDDTRGFTTGELAPEGSENPQARGEESDYYGIGKTLAYIRKNTHGYPQKRFQKLEAGLLCPDPAKRLASKEEIEKALNSSDARGKAWWIAVAVATVFIASAGIFYSRLSVKSEREVPVNEEAPVNEVNTIQVYDDIRQPEIGFSDTEGGASDRSGAQTPKENGASDRSVAQTTKENNPSDNVVDNQAAPDQSYERLRAEMEKAVNKNFADFEKMLSTFLHDKKYSEEDYKAINDAYFAALHKTFDTAPYKTRYPKLSPSLIDDTMADVLQEVEKKRWESSYKKYRSLAEGHSR